MRPSPVFLQSIRQRLRNTRRTQDDRRYARRRLQAQLLEDRRLLATIPLSSSCSLIDAIHSANNDAAIGGCVAGNGADTIVMQPGSIHTYSSPTDIAGDISGLGQTALPSVESDITIHGNGSILERANTSERFRLLTVLGIGGRDGKLRLRDLTIQGGDPRQGVARGSGGGILNYFGELSLDNVGVSNNRAGQDRGGGIANHSGTLTVKDSRILNNSSRHGGGGISSWYGTVTIDSSTIASNTTDTDGAGILVWNISTVNITNSTISHNSAIDRGGALYLDGTHQSPSVTLSSSTLANNSGDSGGGIYISHEAILDIGNTIITESSGGDCFYFVGTGLTLNGENNLIDDHESGICSSISSAKITNFDLTLADNGGPTLTHALLPGSNAIDAVSSRSPITDQRGVSRPQGSAGDIGAFELVLPDFDFGDAPQSYSTTYPADAARHDATGPQFGSTRDAEQVGQPSSNADGDGADEDGLVSYSGLSVGHSGAVITVNASAAAKFDAWIDFNGDGIFAESAERIADSLNLVAGNNNVLFDVPDWADPGETFARFRVSSAGNLAPTGPATDGEVEDHRITINAPPTFAIYDESLNASDLLPFATAGTVGSDMDGTYLDLGPRANPVQIALEMPLVPAGSNVSQISLAIDTDTLPTDDDLGLAITDGTHVVTLLRLDDSGGSFWLDDYAYGSGEMSRLGRNMLTSGIGFPEDFQVDFDFLSPQVTRIVVSGNGTSVTADSSVALDPSAELSLVLVGNNANEQYRIRSINATVRADDREIVLSPTQLQTQSTFFERSHTLGSDGAGPYLDLGATNNVFEKSLQWTLATSGSDVRRIDLEIATDLHPASSQHDIGLAVTDGNHVVTIVRPEDNGGSFWLDVYEDGPNQMNRLERQQLVSGLGFPLDFRVEFELISPSQTRVTAIGNGSVVTTTTANALDPDAELSLVIVGNNAEEQYRIRSIRSKVHTSRTSINTRIDEGAMATLTGQFADTDAGDSHSVIVDWGDGQIETIGLSSGARSFAIPHTYNDTAAGGAVEHQVRVQIIDGADAVSSPANEWVAVPNVAPTDLVLDPLAGVNEGETTTLSGAFVDPGLNDQHTLQIDWGDGTVQSTTLPVGSRSFSIEKDTPYSDDNPSGTASDNYDISVEVLDNDGAAITELLTARIECRERCADARPNCRRLCKC